MMELMHTMSTIAAIGVFFAMILCVLIGMWICVDQIIFDGKISQKVKARIQKFFGV